MVTSDHNKAVARAHSEASKRLKHMFHAEYRALVLAVFEERGLKVQRRRTQPEILHDQLEAARKLLAEHE